MLLKEISEILQAEQLVVRDDPPRMVTMVCACDLMSEVLSYAKPGALLLTVLTNPQVVRTAEFAELAGICFVRGKRPPQATIALAEAKGISLLISPYSMFEVCGRLHRQHLEGC